MNFFIYWVWKSVNERSFSGRNEKDDPAVHGLLPEPSAASQDHALLEQANRLFALWLEESEGVKHVEEIKDMHIRRYIIELQSRGKYIAIRIPFSENVPASSAVRDVYIAAPHSHC